MRRGFYVSRRIFGLGRGRWSEPLSSRKLAGAVGFNTWLMECRTDKKQSFSEKVTAVEKLLAGDEKS